MADTRELQLLLTMKDQASKELKGFADGFEKHRKTIGTTMTVIGGAITGFMGLSVKAFSEAEKQMAIVDAGIQTFSNDVIKVMGGSMDTARDKIKKFGGEMQSLTGISDEVASVGLTKLIQTTSDYEGALKGASLAADLARWKQIDYATSVDIVQKVMGGNLGILSRYGIVLGENATKEEAMAELMRLTQGQAEAYGETLAGQTEIMKQTFGDLQETIGSALIPVLTKALNTIKPLIDKVAEWINKNPELANKIILVVAAVGGLMLVLGPLLIALPAIVAGFTAIGTVLAFLVSPIGLLIAAFVLLGFFIKQVMDNWASAMEGIKMLWGMLVAWIKAGVVSLGEAFGTFVDGIYQSMVGTWEGIKEAFKSGINWVIDKLNAFVRAANKITSKLNVVPGVNIPMIPEIPKLAKGGIVTRPTTALIGEAGPEAVIPLKKMGEMGGITINVYGDVSGNELISKVSEGIMKNLMLQQRVAI